MRIRAGTACSFARDGRGLPTIARNAASPGPLSCKASCADVGVEEWTGSVCAQTRTAPSGRELDHAGGGELQPGARRQDKPGQGLDGPRPILALVALDVDPRHRRI